MRRRICLCAGLWHSRASGRPLSQLRPAPAAVARTPPPKLPGTDARLACYLVHGMPTSGAVMAGRDSRPPDAPAAGESSLLAAGSDAPSGSAAQRMYSSSAWYSVNSMFDATSVMPSDWNAGKSCSADHRSIWALNCHTVTTWSPFSSVPAAQASGPSMSCAGCAWRTPRGSRRSLPRRRRDVDVRHVRPAFPEFVLAGRTLRESPDPAIRGITHWSTHSPSAWVFADGSRHALRWPRRRSGCGCGARSIR